MNIRLFWIFGRKYNKRNIILKHDMNNILLNYELIYTLYYRVCFVNTFIKQSFIPFAWKRKN